MEWFFLFATLGVILYKLMPAGSVIRGVLILACVLSAVIFNESSPFGFSRPGYFAKAVYSLNSQTGYVYYPLANKRTAVIYDIESSNPKYTYLINVRDINGNRLFSDYICRSENYATRFYCATSQYYEWSASPYIDFD